MDGVLADTDAGFVKKWRQLYETEVPFDVVDRSHFFMSPESNATKNSSEANKIFKQPDFWIDLEPKHGAFEAVEYMHETGHEVFILTSAGIRYPLAASEKYEWVARHFGLDMVSRLIITPAKHMVQGDILIDDRPQLMFIEQASWEHVLYDTPYNAKVTDKRRLTWGNYKDILKI